MIAYIYFIYLSMLTPGWGEGADPGEFDIFTRARVKFPTPGLLENVKFPPVGTAFCPKQVVAISNSRPQGRSRMSKSPPREKLPVDSPQICINFVFRLKKKQRQRLVDSSDLAMLCYYKVYYFICFTLIFLHLRELRVPCNVTKTRFCWLTISHVDIFVCFYCFLSCDQFYL